MAWTLTAERSCYALALLPFAADYVLNGSVPSSAGAFAAAAMLSAVMLALVLLTRHNRRLTDRVDALRKTLNDAIIHDLGNPMTSIMGCLSELGEEGDRGRRESLVALALRSCRAQMTLLDTLSDSNRLEGGDLVLVRRPMDVAALMRESLDGVRGTAASRGVRLETKGPSDPPPILVDPSLFPRVLLNLLHNALKYTPKGGAVTLAAEPCEGGVRFLVRDTGTGIGAEHLSRLFGKYYRVEGGDQTSRRGTGLGLYFCRLVVEAHGGRIGVLSEPGRGTTILVSLPGSKDGGPAMPAASEEGRLIGPGPGGGRRLDSPDGPERPLLRAEQHDE